MSSPMLSKRFRGFLPVIVDVETGGVDPQHDALLELAAITITMDEQGFISPDQSFHYHIEPSAGMRLDPKALAFNKIDPGHPFRFAEPEADVLKNLFEVIKEDCQRKKCRRAVLVGQNAWFDQQFLNAAAKRHGLTKTHPFHTFTSFDTATLSGLVFGQTVLSRALALANIPFNTDDAHSALYDAQCTALLFCEIVNKFQKMGGWPLPPLTT